MFSLRMSGAIAATVLFAGIAPSALAAEPPPPPGLSGSVGLSAVSMPTYLGSPHRATVAAPDLSLSYRTKDWGHVDLDSHGLTWNVEQGDFWGGVLLGVDPGRKQKKPSGAYPIPGDERLRGMGDVRSSAEVGVLAGYGPVGVTARKAVGHRGSEGAQVDLAARLPLPLGNGVALSLDATATWADRHYMQSYFGVTAAQAASTGYALYTPRSGIARFNLGVSAEYPLGPQWSLTGSVGAVRLLGDARRSPLVSKPTGATASLGVAYRF